MPFTTTDLATIEAAIAKGELVVQYADRRVQYRSIDELLRVREVIARSLARPRPRQYRIYTQRGL